jgi:predicted kinase
VIVVMAGLPGTGKSTLAQELAARLDAVVLSKDRIRDATFGALVDYSSAQDDFCMELIYQTAGYLHETRLGTPVIVDGRTFSRRVQVERALQALPEAQRWIECVCDDEVARARLDAAPGHLARNRTYALYCAVKTAADPLEIPRLTIDTGRLAPAAALARCLSYLGV